MLSESEPGIHKQVPLTDARAKLSDIVNEVMYKGDTYVISRMGKPAVAVVPLHVLHQWQAHRNEQFAILDQIRHKNRNSPLTHLSDEALLDRMDALVHEARADAP